MHTKFLVSAAAGALFAMTGAAFAQSAVVATTDLNVRAGPGPQHQVLGVLGAGQSVNLDGCLQSRKWCVVAFDGGQGWVYSDYLTGDFGGTQVVVTERPTDSGVRIVEAPADVDGVVTGAVVGTISGGAAATVIDPPERIRTYVTANEFEPVYLDGEVVVGAGLPETVTLREIPDYEYRYSYVNGQPVLVEPGTRRIVYVMR
jgi:uncharacterized protein YraI